MPDYQIVNVPGVGRVRFPADMNEDALRAAVQDVHRQGQERASRQAAGFGEGMPWGSLAAVAGAPAAIAGLGAAAGTLPPIVGRVISHPVTGAIAGGVEGYRKNGVLGVPLGALEGAVYGKLGGGLLTRGLGAIRTARATSAAAEPIAEGLADIGHNLVLSPPDVARQAQLLKLAQEATRTRGTIAATRPVTAPAASWLEEALR